MGIRLKQARKTLTMKLSCKMFPRTLGPFYERIRPYGFLLFLLLIYSGLLQYLLYPVSLFVVPAYFLLFLATSF